MQSSILSLGDLCLTSYIEAKNGFGLHMDQVKPDNYLNAMKVLKYDSFSQASTILTINNSTSWFLRSSTNRPSALRRCLCSLCTFGYSPPPFSVSAHMSLCSLLSAVRLELSSRIFSSAVLSQKLGICPFRESASVCLRCGMRAQHVI